MKWEAFGRVWLNPTLGSAGHRLSLLTFCNYWSICPSHLLLNTANYDVLVCDDLERSNVPIKLQENQSNSGFTVEYIN